MPRVQYVDPANEVRITRKMHTPREITRLDVWLRKARKVIPEIPDTIGDREWHIAKQEANTDYIRFDLKDKYGNRVYVVIFRQMDMGI